MRGRRERARGMRRQRRFPIPSDALWLIHYIPQAITQATCFVSPLIVSISLCLYLSLRRSLDLCLSFSLSPLRHSCVILAVFLPTLSPSRSAHSSVALAALSRCSRVFSFSPRVCLFNVKTLTDWCVCDVGPVLMSSALHLAGCQVSASCCRTHLKILEFTKRLRGLNLRPADFSATLLLFFLCLCSKTQNPLKDAVNVGKNDFPSIV